MVMERFEKTLFCSARVGRFCPAWDDNMKERKQILKCDISGKEAGFMDQETEMREEMP